MLPESISNHIAGGTVDIGWPDGTVQRISHAVLRRHCPCADCRATRAGEGRLPDISTATRITGIVPVGVYAVQLVFSDGHERGIFPWAYLKGIVRELDQFDGRVVDMGRVDTTRHGDPDLPCQLHGQS